MDLQFESGEGMAEVIKAVKEDNGVFRGTKLKYVNDSEILVVRTVIGMRLINMLSNFKFHTIVN